MKFIFVFFLCFTALLNSQNNYPQDYFNSPLEIPLLLAGTFAELRPNHFHSGLDIKTRQQEGLNVNACANGYVSRINVSPFGYGKVLYITHPNGYTTVYAHLQKFSPKIEAYVRKHQYERETFAIELFPRAEELPVLKSEFVAYSGNTGSSEGPHLHFEIRDKQERALNPMLFGFDIKDTSPPTVRSIYVYPLDEHSFVNNSNTKYKLKLTNQKTGVYNAEQIDAIGNIGFAIITSDRQDLTGNANGVYNIETYVNGTKNFEIDFKQFAFAETSYINDLIDYKHFLTYGERIQKLFNKNPALSMYKSVVNNGIIKIQDSTNTIYKIKVRDYKNNETWVTVNVKGVNNNVSIAAPQKTTPYFIKYDDPKVLKEGSVTVNFQNDTFFDDLYLDFEVTDDEVKIHNSSVAVKKPFTISFDISKYSEEDKNKLYIARLVGSKKLRYAVNTTRKDNTLTANPKLLGTYGLAIDNSNPTASAVNFKYKQWLSNYRFLKVKIGDSGSGISSYRATINGKWILMEYDNKTKVLTYDFNDHTISESENNLKVIVTDNVGNNFTFESLFYRK